MKKKLAKILPLLLIVFLLTACGGEEGPKEVKDMEYSITVNETTIGGTYSGTVLNELPEGEGTFISSESGVYEYTGTWAEGAITGNGKLKTDSYTMPFSNNTTRQGKYSGYVVNGVPEGIGTFNTQNPNGDKYTYEGEWKNGIWHGQGKLVYEDADAIGREGTFVNGEFTPTPLELFGYLFSLEKTSLCDNAQEIIKNNEDLFYGEVSDISEELRDKDFNLAQFKKNPNSSIKGVIEVSNLVVVQIFEYEAKEMQCNIPKDNITYFLARDWQDNVYYCFMVGSAPENIVENSNIKLSAVPLNFITYKNTANEDVWAVACAAVKIN